MILLDSDHVTALKYLDSERYRRLTARLAMVVDDVIGTTIISVEEQMRGWLAAIAKERQAQRQIGPYRELAELFEYFQQFLIVPFDQPAVDTSTNSTAFGSARWIARSPPSRSPTTHCCSRPTHATSRKCPA